jgi:hypothetical protein
MFTPIPREGISLSWQEQAKDTYSNQTDKREIEKDKIR